MNSVNIASNMEALLRAIFHYDTQEEALSWEQNDGKYPRGLKKQKIIRLYQEGWKQRDITKLMRVDKSYVSRVLGKG